MDAFTTPLVHASTEQLAALNKNMSQKAASAVAEDGDDADYEDQEGDEDYDEDYEEYKEYILSEVRAAAIYAQMRTTGHIGH